MRNDLIDSISPDSSPFDAAVNVQIDLYRFDLLVQVSILVTVLDNDIALI
jgi:hypothetical protein